VGFPLFLFPSPTYILPLPKGGGGFEVKEGEGSERGKVPPISSPSKRGRTKVGVSFVSSPSKRGRIKKGVSSFSSPHFEGED